MISAWHLLVGGLVAATDLLDGSTLSQAAPLGVCNAGTPRLALSNQRPGWPAWGPNGSNRRFQSADAAGLSASDVPRLRLKWAVSLGEANLARAHPTVAGGWVFVGSETGAVFALEATTGCEHWRFQTAAPARSAVVVGTAGGRPMAFVGDLGASMYALDAATGALRWKVRVDDHVAATITGTPALSRGRLYVTVSSYEEALAGGPAYECCRFRGSVVALDAATGKVLWKTYTVAEAPRPTKRNSAGAQLYGPSGAAIWSAPTLDDRRPVLYAATGDNYSAPATNTSDAILALDTRTGHILWARQLTVNDATNMSCDFPGKVNCPDADGPDADFGQPPILVSLPGGRRALVIGQKSGMVHAIDPDHEGAILWQTRIGPGGKLGGSQWGSAADGSNVYVALSGLTLGAVGDTTSPAGFRLVPDPAKGGGLFALRLTNGSQVWHAGPVPCGETAPCSPAQSAALSMIPGVVFSGSVDGHLRAYSARDGAILWDANTGLGQQTVNGGMAHGGSLDAGGAVIAGGIVLVKSGYAQWGGLPGNVLLAYSVDAR